MSGLRSKVTVTGSLTPESALVKDATGAAIANPAFTDGVLLDAANGIWQCDAAAPDGTYTAAHLIRLKNSNPVVSVLSTGTQTVSGNAAGKKVLVPVIGTSLDKGWYQGGDHSTVAMDALLPSRLAGDGNTYTVINLAQSGESARQWLASTTADNNLKAVNTQGYDLVVFVIDHTVNDAVQLLNGALATGSDVFASLTQVHQKVLAFGATKNIATKTIQITSSTAFSAAAYYGLSGYAPATDASDVRAIMEDTDARVRASYSQLGASDYQDLSTVVQFNYHSNQVPDRTVYQSDDLHLTDKGYGMRADQIATGVKRVVAGGAPSPVVPYVPPAGAPWSGAIAPESVEDTSNNTNKLAYTGPWVSNPASIASGGNCHVLQPTDSGTVIVRGKGVGFRLATTCSPSDMQNRASGSYKVNGGPAVNFTQAKANPDGSDAVYIYYEVTLFSQVTEATVVFTFTADGQHYPIWDRIDWF